MTSPYKNSEHISKVVMMRLLMVVGSW